MASPALRRPENTPGSFFVDSSCIDCGTCRWMAPETFDRHTGASRVYHQPKTPQTTRRALQALVACPTASIGSGAIRGAREAAADFPLPVTDNIYHCGYHAESSFGAASYLIVRPRGNILVDSPRYNEGLARRIEALGGARWMFLTHIDDVADHEKYRARLGCDRIIHADDARGSVQHAEWLLRGQDTVSLGPDVLLIPTPGHTRGSVCLLHRETLFTGDTLAWSAQRQALIGFRSACWYSWEALGASLARLRAHRFSRVLPGHGWPVHRPADVMGTLLEQTIAGM